MNDRVDRLAKELEVAIADGEVDAAVDLVKKLVAMRAQLTVEAQAGVPVQEEQITIRVYIEDRESTGGCIPFRVRPSDTIRHIKRKMLSTYMFPEEVQRWIIGKRLPKDDETLSECNIRSTGSSVFLYLVSSQSIGLIRGNINNQIQPTEVDQRGPGDADQSSSTSFSSANSSVTDAASPIRVNPSNAIPRDPIPGPVSDQSRSTLTSRAKAEKKSRTEAEQGWCCAQCTYKNLPTRPGCEICGYGRPDDYTVPENHPISERELNRLQREQQMEQQTIEVAAGNVRRPHDLISDNEVKLLLDINDRINDYEDGDLNQLG